MVRPVSTKAINMGTVRRISSGVTLLVGAGEKDGKPNGDGENVDPRGDGTCDVEGKEEGETIDGADEG